MGWFKVDHFLGKIFVDLFSTFQFVDPEMQGSFHTVLLLRFQRWFCSLRCVRMFKGIGFPLVQYELGTLVSHPRKPNPRLMAHSQGGVSFSKATALDSIAQNSRGF